MLDKLFLPDKIAVVGASREEGKTGHEVFDNLLHDFEGEVVPVNPNADEVHGVEATGDIPEGTDLAVVVVPAKVVPDVLKDAGGKDVGAAIVISAGFSETGNPELEDRIAEIAEENGISLLGPNVLGLINTENSMNASFASKMPSSGSISFMSQSGAFCTAILDYAKAEHIGFRHFVSLGNKAMLNEVDFLQKWRGDGTETIIGYTEGIEDGREFLKEARKTSRGKPIVMVKSGRTSQGSNAASSHTGSIAGSYQAYRAAFKQAGIIEAESSSDLLDYGRALAYQPLPAGKRVAVITNAGGPGVITTDEVSEHGMEMAKFDSDTRQALREALPDEAAIHNPVDLIGDAGHERYKNALEAVLEDEGVDAVIAILTPQANTEIEKTAKTIVNAQGGVDKPVFASFMGEQDVMPGIEILERNDVPDFQDPMDAVKTLESMHGYRAFLDQDRTLRGVSYDTRKGEKAVKNYSGFEEGMALFEAYGFDLALSEVAGSPMNAVEAASKAGFPVVMKVDSPQVTHKTDIGAVETGIDSKDEVREAFREITEAVYHNHSGEAEINGVIVQEELEGLEVALGLKRDPQFGPMVMVGLGGIYIEALRDVSFRIAPVSEEEAEQMIEELQSHELFEGVRGQEHDLEALKSAIIKLGEIGRNHPEVQSVDLNPVILTGDKAFVTDIVVDVGDVE